MSDNETVRLVNDATAILALRESDFDAYSAFGEVVDNSIQAGAKSIQIKVKSSADRNGHEFVDSIAFGDDGAGMPADVLRRCLQLGYSTRFNDRSGIGRFGVGVTLAAINQCRRVDLYSKVDGGSWLWTYVDLDEISSTPPKQESIPLPEKGDVPNDLARLVGTQSGTLMIWSKYDRQPATPAEMIEEMNVWMGRTYRYFIWDGLAIRIMGREVPVIDPLYLRWDKTRFPEDPSGHAYESIVISWPVPEDARQFTKAENSNITVRMSLVHESLRPEQHSGARKPAKDRYIDRNEGVSIIRNRREVFYGRIPYWPGSDEFKDRWWGCEISFDALLDRAFTVKNIKRGAIPNKQLKDTIWGRIAATRQTALESVTAVWEKAKRNDREKKLNEAGELHTGHEEAERIAGQTPVDKNALDKNKDFDNEARTLVDDIKRDLPREKQAAWIAKWKAQPFTIHEDSWQGPGFLEAVHLGGHDVLKYNLRHLFWVETGEIIKALEKGSEEYQHAVYLRNLIDLLLISHSKAEAKFDGEQEWTAERFVEMLRMNWGLYLENYLSTWKKERGG